MKDDSDRVFVAFLVEQNGHEFYERLHAQPLGADLYCLDNSPFYAYGVSFGDVVLAPCEGGAPTYRKTVNRRGHSTYRVRLAAGCGHDAFLKRWTDLAELGCTFEGSDAGAARLYSVDVPPDVDVHAVYALLQAGETSGVWVFEEGNYCAEGERDSRDH